MTNYIYADSEPGDFCKVRVGVADIGRENYASPTLLEYSESLFVRSKSGRRLLQKHVLNLMEKTDLPFLTPKGLLNLDGTREYFGVN